MASVNSPIRRIIKPILFRILGKKGYLYLQYLAKVKDIKGKLVEEKEMVLLPYFVKEGDEVIDLGANYAYYSVRLSGLVGRSGKVYAFEPIPFTYEVCRKVINYFKADNVQLFKKGAGILNESVEFNVPIVDFGAISAGQAHFSNRNNNLEGKEQFYKFDKHEKIKCEVVRLDDFIGAELKNLSFVKIDIEGAEYYALKGMEQLLKKIKPVILVEIQPFFLEGFNLKEQIVLDYIKNELDYQIFYFDVSDSKLHQFKGDLWDDNYILIHSSRIKEFKNSIAE